MRLLYLAKVENGLPERQGVLTLFTDNKKTDCEFSYARPKDKRIMFDSLKKPHTLITIILTLILLASVFLFPTFTPKVSMLVLLISIGLALKIILLKHWDAYQKAECTREKMNRNLILDLLGLLLTMGAAMYTGRLAGGYVGLHAGFWFGMIAGFLGGFAAAWAVRSAWGRVVAVR
jgi:hypothetical protein